MIKSFAHKVLERFFTKGSTSGIQAEYAPRISLMLDAIDAAAEVKELDLPGFRLHRLKGNKRNLWSVRVSANWRITFEFADGDAHILNLEDYH
jgi:proteic killer suppression protein